MLTFEQIELLKTTIAKGLTDLEFQLFLSVCERTGLDPFARQICPVLRWDSKSNKNIMSVQVQVDGYRMIAQSTGEYAGCDRVRFDEDLTLYEHCQTKRGNPETASITVYRLVKGIRCPFFAEVSWNDFYPGDKLGFIWKSKPHQMMAKSVESQALRKAFQSELKHLVTEEEIAIEGVDPTTRQVRRSDDWFDMQTQLREAGSIEEVNAIAASTRDRMPMTGNSYQMDKELAIASERLEMTTIPGIARSLPSKPAAKPSTPSEAPETETQKKPSNENSQRIKEVCELLGMKGKLTAEAYKAAAPVQGLNKPSEELTSAECSRVIDEILAQWGLRQKCFKAINHARSAFVLLMESLEVGVTMPAIVASWKAECDRRLAEKSQEVPAATW